MEKNQEDSDIPLQIFSGQQNSSNTENIQPPPQTYPNVTYIVPQLPAGYEYNGPPYPQAPVQMVVSRNVEAGKEHQSTFICSIIVTFLCCWPLGIVAIQNAKKAKDYAEQNQPELAEEYRSKARRYIKMSIVGGILGTIIIICIYVGISVFYKQLIQQMYNTAGNSYET